MPVVECSGRESEYVRRLVLGLPLPSAPRVGGGKIRAK